MHTTGPEQAPTGASTTHSGTTSEETTATTGDAAAQQTGTDGAHDRPGDNETAVITAGAPAPWWTQTLTAIDPDAPEATGGDVTLTHADAYRYLSLGLALTDAALLHSSIPDPGHWESRVGVTLTAGNGEGTTAALAFLRASGTDPLAAEQMLLRGFTDRHLTGVLDAEQLNAVFDWRGYPMGDGRRDGDRPTLVLEHVIDGSLPFELIEHGYRRSVLRDTAEFLFDPEARAAAHGTDEDAEAILAAMDSLPTVLDVMDRQPDQRRVGRHPLTLKTAWQACRMFGDAYARTRSLTEVVPHDLTLDQCNRIAEAVRNGCAAERAAELLEEPNLTTEQAIATLTGETSSAIAEGWL